MGRNLTLFADASAIVAIIGCEPERLDFLQQIESADACLWSALACWETVAALRSSHGLSIKEAQGRVEHFEQEFGFEMVPIAVAELSIALDAYERFGRGRHPAQLNFGDCFAYACAKANRATLLYKGGDFAKTDLA